MVGSIDTLMSDKDKPFDLEHLRTVFLRRRKLFMHWALPCLMLTFIVALALPPTYRSTATILIEQQEIPQDLVRSTITSYADQRIQIITQRVMTTTNLLQIMDKFDLYQEERRQQSLETIFEAMRDDIGTEMISADVIDPRSGRPMAATIAFRVSYDARNPAIAKSVASEITTLFLQENLSNRRQQAEQTESFLTDEADKLNKEIEQLGKQIARFKETNFQALPEHTELNLQHLERAEREIADVTLRINSLREQENHLEAERSLLDPYAPFVGNANEQLLGTEARLKVLQNELALLKAQYTDLHPEVQRTQRDIEALQARQRSQTGEPNNPAWIQLDTQIKNLKVERESLDTKYRELQAKREEYENRLATSPVIENQYRDLLQALETRTLKYREIRAKQQEANLAFSLETEQKGERFTLLEPALTPEHPVKPNRKAVFLLGMLLSFGLAAGAVYLKETTDRSVHRKDDLKALLGAMPLATVPYIDTPYEQHDSRKQGRHLKVSTLAVLISGIVLFHFLIKPLDVIWFMLMRKLGV
ncbi:MAG: hypothetical protein IPM37_02975 [Hahellaceae bacterium]|nr:hypothetical protein [Hahellaceae bacterium]